MRCDIKGMALGTILLSMVVFSFVLFTAVSASISHLKLVEGTVRGDHARNLAEAALSQALTNLISSNFTFGQNGTDRVEVEFPDLPDGQGIVTFDMGETGFSKGYSKFNLESDSGTVGASDHAVPARTVHLVARGKVGHTEKWMECYYYKPPFPDGLAATGPIEANALYLAGVRNAQQYIPPPGQTAPDQILPANLFSNSEEVLASDIGPDCLIKGSAGAVGGVSVDPTSVVEGEVLPGSEPRLIPELDVVERIAAIETNAILTASTGGTLTLDQQWFSRCNGNLTVGGDLNLNGSALVVRGDLSVAGAIMGSGIILTEGDIEILDGRSSVSANDQVAVGCTGDFKLRAASPEGNFFQGLMYSEGEFEAKDITVLGATVVNGQAPALGSVVLDNVRMIYTPGSVTTALRRPQGIILKRPGSNIEYVGAFSFSVRRAPDGYYLDSRAYFSDNEDVVASGEVIEDNPMVWRQHSAFPPPGDPDSADGSGNNYFRARSFPGIFLGSPNPDPNLIRQNVAVPINQFFKEGIEIGTFSDDYPAADQNRVKNSIVDTVLRLSSGVPDQYTVSFNPNNLLAEVNGTSRILLWRPFR